MNGSRLAQDHEDHRLSPAVAAFAGSQTWQLAADLIRRPRFPEALAGYCTAMTRPVGLSWPVNKMFSQKQRYITCYLLIGNYTRFRRDPAGAAPPTLSALQRAAPASARQVAGFIHALRIGGYVIATPGEADRRTLHLRPAPALLTEIARSPLAFLDAARAILGPPGAGHRPFAGDETRLADWLGRSTELYQAGDIYFSPFPTVVHFTERDSGYPLLAAVIGAHCAARSGGTPPGLSLTYDALAERFQVSRQHIGNILTEADRKGWFSVAAGGRLIGVSQELLQEFSTWAAGQMAHFHLLAEEMAGQGPAGCVPREEHSRADTVLFQRLKDKTREENDR